MSGEPAPAAKPMVLVWAGNDPTGGAGLAADTAALLSQGCRCCPVVTAVTVQDTCGLQALNPVDADLVEQQARQVLADLPVAAFKIGVIGSVDNALAIARVLVDHPQLPVVLDPVLRAGGDSGGALADEGMDEVLRAALLPLTTVLTPNADEAARLAPGLPDALSRARFLLDCGSEHVLLTGGDQPGAAVVNTLYSGDGECQREEWQRLPGHYHGSGCTMASALAGLLARDVPIADAARQAQTYTWMALKHAPASESAMARGQQLPDRMYWDQDKIQGDIQGDIMARKLR